MNLRVLVRGGGDLASGIIIRMAKVGWGILVSELDAPLAVRRLVSFASAVYDQSVTIEGIEGVLVRSHCEVELAINRQQIPVIIDPNNDIMSFFGPDVVIDARMLKKPINYSVEDSRSLIIGLGPGFTAGQNCHAVIETMRGPYLGRVYWQGGAEQDTGIPEMVRGMQAERVLRAPVTGIVKTVAEIGSTVQRGSLVIEVDNKPVFAPFDGVLRGLVHSGLTVRQGMKIGDIDPRGDPELCRLVSDKALAVGGGVLEAVLTWMHRHQ